MLSLLLCQAFSSSWSTLDDRAIIKKPDTMNETLALHNAVEPQILLRPFGFQSQDLSAEGFYHSMYFGLVVLVLAFPIFQIKKVVCRRNSMRDFFSRTLLVHRWRVVCYFFESTQIALVVCTAGRLGNTSTAVGCSFIDYFSAFAGLPLVLTTEKVYNSIMYSGSNRWIVDQWGTMAFGNN